MLSDIECHPKRIIQIVSGSRSGSTLLKTILSQSPNIVSLAGEEEPYFSLLGNGYGFTSNSDSFLEIQNPSLFRRLIQTELDGVNSWEWRLRLQYSGRLLTRLLDQLPKLDIGNPIPWLKFNGIWGYYDGCRSEERLPFNGIIHHEMLPYVLPKGKQELADKVLLLKAPYNTFRFGVMEKIFPNSQFSYVFLTRNPGATINGLIDGWNADYGFFKHKTPWGWWKFEMPKGWENYVQETIEDKAVFQWRTAAELLINGHWKDVPGVRLQFEDLLLHPQACIELLCSELNVTCPKVTELPLVMTTETPKPGRWKKKQTQILNLLSPHNKLIEQNGYKDATLWR